MKEVCYRVVGWILVAIIALCGVAAGLHILVNVLPKSGAADWVVAVGTIGTLVGTIALARQETRRRHRQEHDAAVIAAAFMDLPLAYCQQLLQGVIDGLRQPVQDDLENPWAKFAVNLGACRVWTRDELMPLIYLGNHVAADIALAQDYIRTSRDRMMTIARRKDAVDIYLHELTEFNEEQIGVLEDALRRIDNAYNSCSRLLESARIV